MSLSPYMRAYFELDAEKDHQKREAEAQAARKAKEDEQRMQNLHGYVAKLKPLMELIAADATMVKRIGEASEQIFSTHAALSAKIGVADENRAVARLVVRIEGDGRVNVSISLLDTDPVFTQRAVGGTDHVGSMTDTDIITKLEHSISQAIVSAMRAAA